MRLVEVVFTLIFLPLVFVVVYLNSYSQMNYGILHTSSFRFEKWTGIIDEPFRPDGRVLLPPERVELAVRKVILPKKINSTKKTVQQE